MFKKVSARVAVSILMSLFAGIFIYQVFNIIENKVSVVVAARDVMPFEMLTEDAVTTVMVSKDALDTLGTKVVSDKDMVIGAITRVGLKKGSIIEKTPDTLLFDDEKTIALNYDGKVDKAYFVPYEKRVIAIEVDGSGSLSGQLKPGDFVDVIFSSKDSGGGGSFSNMILQHLEIFQIAKSEQATEIKDGKEQKKTVHLLATPEECVAIAAAKRNGVIDLVLNPLKGETKHVDAVNILEFQAQEPLEKMTLINNYISMVKEDRYLSPALKQEMIISLNKEMDIETIRQSISASKLNETQKNKLLADLGMMMPETYESSLADLNSVLDIVGDSSLTDTEKVEFMNLLESKQASIMKGKKAVDIGKIIQEIKTSKMPQELKDKTIKMLENFKNK